MKKSMKLITSFLTVCMLFTICTANVAAADPYTYTVKLFAGNQGTVNGSTEITWSNLAAGAALDMTAVNMQPTDEKYYAKGIRLSGRDNNDVYARTIFTVDQDADYVVAYGIRANMVAYTVNYQDANGGVLADSETYYGDVGDKPVVAYRYIDGYVPQATAMTGTLSSNAADNVFTFVYTPAATGGTTTTTTTTVVTTAAGTPAAPTTPATTPAATTPATTTPAAATPAGAAATPEDAAAAADANAAADATAGGELVQNPDEETPQSLVDLDEEETPTSNIDADKKSNSPLIAGIVIGVAALVGLGALVFFWIKRRKDAM